MPESEKEVLGVEPPAKRRKQVYTFKDGMAGWMTGVCCHFANGLRKKK